MSEWHKADEKERSLILTRFGHYGRLCTYLPTYSSLLSFSTSKKTSSRSSFLGGEQQLETIFRWFQAEIEIKAVALENRGHTVGLLICRKKCNSRKSYYWSLLDNASNYLVGCVIQKRTTDCSTASNSATCDTNFSLNIFSPFSSHCGAPPPPQSAEFAYIRVRAQNKYMVYSATGVALKLWQEDPRALKRGAAPHHHSTSIYSGAKGLFFTNVVHQDVHTCKANILCLLLLTLVTLAFI